MYLKEGVFGIEHELDPVGIQLLFRSETRCEGAGQKHRPRQGGGPLGPDAAGGELKAQKHQKTVEI